MLVGRWGAGEADFALRAGMAPAPRLSETAAIQAVWAWFIRNRDRDVPFAEVVARVRARAPGTNVERIKSEFARRHRRALRLGKWG